MSFDNGSHSFVFHSIFTQLKLNLPHPDYLSLSSMSFAILSDSESTGSVHNQKIKQWNLDTPSQITKAEKTVFW